MTSSRACYRLDEQRAAAAIEFISRLRHTKGRWAGRPFQLHPVQRKIVIDLFGQVDRRGLRRYRTAYISKARKNGKTELAAAFALCLLTDGEMGAEIYSAAADREQASLVFNAAARMVEQSPGLSRRLRVIESQKRIVYYATKSFYHAISAEAYSKHGYNPYAVIYDELHAAPNRELWDVLRTGMGAREQPLMIAITTAGYDENSICYEQYQKAKAVLSGLDDDPTFYAFIAEADPDDDWEDERVWAKANPLLDITVSREFLRSEYKEAKRSPAFQNAFRRLYLNQWVRQEERWLDLRAWDESAGLMPPLETLKGRPCFAGLDLSSSIDVTALVLDFPFEDGHHVWLAEFFIPQEEMYEREKRDRVPYSHWVREGFVKATPGNVIDYEFVIDAIVKAAERYDLREVAYDRWGAVQISQRLQEMGITVVPFGQGFSSMSAPTKELMTLVLSRKLVHGGNPVLRWMADCMTVKQDPAGNIKPVKPDRLKSSKRIDGIVAGIMALDRALRHAEPEASVYEQRGVLVV